MEDFYLSIRRHTYCSDAENGTGQRLATVGRQAKMLVSLVEKASPLRYGSVIRYYMRFVIGLSILSVIFSNRYQCSVLNMERGVMCHIRQMMNASNEYPTQTVGWGIWACSFSRLTCRSLIFIIRSTCRAVAPRLLGSVVPKWLAYLLFCTSTKHDCSILRRYAAGFVCQS